MNDRVVAKFGGSSLATSEQFKKVKKIVKSNKSRRYIVPSAPGKRHSKDFKITDVLYLCHAHVKNGIPFDDVFGLIEERYNELKAELKVKVDIKNYLEIIKFDIENGASADYIASRGEYLNGLILADYLGYEFVDAKDVIKFNDYGSLDYEVTDKAVAEKLLDMSGYVIPGFYGAMPNGDIKTFSRGGSDITGSIIARGVKASLYENWTDVSGFLMADPRVVSNPMTIEKITYRELRELSYMGANVLHEEAMFPIRDIGIPINIKNTDKPEDKGTLILSEVAAKVSEKKEGKTITGIAGKKDFTIIAIEKSKMNEEQGFCRKLLSILESNGVFFENMPSGIDTVSLVISNDQLKNKLDKIIDEINRQCNPDVIDVQPNIALIAIVGRGMVKTKGVSSRVFNALVKESVNVRMINQGSSEINIIVGVENNDFEKSINGIYEAFVS